MTTIAPPALLNLSDLSSRVDVQGFYERQGVAIVGKSTHTPRDGQEWHGSCPECHGNDRFAFWESGRFSCSLRSSGCGIHGNSPYWFLRDVKGYDHAQALYELGIDQSEIGDSYSQPKTKLLLSMTKDEPPCQKWMDAAAAFCRAAEKCLWGPKGTSALAYLHSRGFTDATIKQAHLGLCPDWHIAPLENWGLDASQLNKSDDPQMKIPKGITIPWFVEGNIWKIQIRRPVPGPTGKYYFEVTGSSDALYNIDSFQPGQPVLLVESELDARSAEQEAGDLVACIATGSTDKALTGRWIGRLKLASHVLQGFDNDENQAGERGAAEWLAVLKNAMRWAPWGHDVNQMLQDGDPVRLWVESGLEELVAEPTETEQGETFDIHYIDGSIETHTLPATPPALFDKLGKPVPPELVERISSFQASPCINCGGLDWIVDPMLPNEYVPVPTPKLICPCLLEKRAESARIDVQRAREDRKSALLRRWK